MEKVSVTLEKASLDWLRQKVEEGRFASVSHGVRVAVEKMRNR